MKHTIRWHLSQTTNTTLIKQQHIKTTTTKLIISVWSYLSQSAVFSQSPINPAKDPALDSGIVVLVFNKGDDPIEEINKMMSFLSTMVTSCFPSMKYQLRNSSNPRQQAMIQD
ncbi:hypothetical protein Tco_0310592, partial [Tanacetum coccineum]